MRSLTCSILLLLAQNLNNGVLAVSPVERVAARRGQSFTAKISAGLQPGFHVNSNTPAEAYLIPLKLSWTSSSLRVEQITYPKPQLEKYDFSPQRVSVFSGAFEIATTFKVLPDSAPGLTQIPGKLRYQACNRKECLPPRTISLQLPVNIL